MRIQLFALSLSTALTMLSIATAEADPYEGLFVGGQAGYRWVDGTFTAPAYSTTIAGNTITFPARSDDYSANSGIVGVHGGYNTKVSPSVLIGLVGDWDFAWGSDKTRSTGSYSVPIDDSLPMTLPISQMSRFESDWQATIRARLGFVDGPWMFYVTGGFAFMNVTWKDLVEVTTVAGVATAINSKTETLTGYAVGGGIENAIDANTIVRLEYLYEDFGDTNMPHGFGPQIGKLDVNAHKLRFAISFAIDTN